MKTSTKNDRRVTRKPARPQPKPSIVKRSVTRREAADAASRFRTGPDGKHYVVRFSAGQRAEHMVLLFSFTGLGVTGLAQTFYTNPLANLILAILGGIDNDRALHHIFAFVFIVLSVYHVGLFVYQRFVNRRTSKMFPEWSDFLHLNEMIRFNLGISQKFPRFDRYTFEEKAEYWALIWGGTVMGITGLMQWFPVFMTEVLPGWAIPVARAFHRWEAILAVLAILTWHFYHVLLKKLNLSMFTGNMTIEEMEEEHALELVYLEKAAAAVGSKVWPVIIEIPLDEPTAAPAAAAKAAEAAPSSKPAAEDPETLQPEAKKPAVDAKGPVEAPKDESFPMPTAEQAPDAAS